MTVPLGPPLPPNPQSAAQPASNISAIVPISRPIIITATLLAFVFGWNNFLWPLIVTNSNHLNVLTVGMANFNSNFSVQWNLILAGSLVALIPMVILFAIFQRYFIQGISTQGRKG